MATVNKTINITAYAVKGNPTCATNFNSGEVCRFLLSRHFGTVDICSFGGDLQRGENGMGYLVPCKECIVWNTNNAMKEM